MIDYLLTFPDDASRSAAFPAPEESPHAPCWGAMGGTVMPVRIVVADAVLSEDGETVISPQVLGAGSWIAIRCNERSAEIEAMPNCLVATNNDLAQAGEPYVYFCRLAPETIMGRVDPVFAGDGYPFQPGQPASALADWLIG